MTPEKIAKIFEEMEDYLFQSMARNLNKHEAWEFEEGFEWVQWQAEQINGLREFREEIQDIVNHTYDSALPHMEQLLTDAYRNGELRAETDISRARGVPAQQSFFGTTPKMRGLVENVLFDINRTRYACINRMNSGYTSILQKADLYAQSGTMTIPQAVDMASKDFVSAGINCVEYSNGARVGIDSYCEMALRTSSRDASALGEGSRRDAWEEHLVVSNVINTTCPHCQKWQGKVFIDDVYANGKKDGKHPLLSKAKEEGFLHPNCRHKPYTYFEGITKLPSQPDKAKTLEQYKAEQKQRYYERNIRKYKRLRDCALDDDNKAKYNDKVKEWSRALDKHLEDNPSLRKNPWRVTERGNTTNLKNNSLPLKSDYPDLFQQEYKNRKLVIADDTKAKLRKEVEHFSKTVSPITDYSKYIFFEPYGHDGIYGAFEENSGRIYLKGYEGKKGLEFISKMSKKMHADGEWATESVYHGIRHEMGHAFVQDLKLQSGWKIKEAEIKALYDSIIDEATRQNIVNNVRLTETYADFISTYGMEDIDEFMAEGLAEYADGRPRPTAKKIYEILTRSNYET